MVLLLNASDGTQRLEIDGLPAGTCGQSFTSVPRRAYGQRAAQGTVGVSGRATLELPPRSVTTPADAER